MGSNDPDKALLDQLLAGDPHARRAFVERMMRPLHKVAARWVSRIARQRNVVMDVDDIIWSTFGRLFEREDHALRQYRAEEGLSVEGWVCLIGHRRAFDVWRAAQKEPPPEPDPGVTNTTPSGAALQDERLIARRKLALLRHELKADPDALAVFELALLGHATKEIADALGISEDAAESRARRMRAKCRKILEAADGSSGIKK